MPEIIKSNSINLNRMMLENFSAPGNLNLTDVWILGCLENTCLA